VRGRCVRCCALRAALSVRGPQKCVSCAVIDPAASEALVTETLAAAAAVRGGATSPGRLMH
jgi:hypothetical protein